MFFVGAFTYGHGIRQFDLATLLVTLLATLLVTLSTVFGVNAT